MQIDYFYNIAKLSDAISLVERILGGAIAFAEGILGNAIAFAEEILRSAIALDERVLREMRSPLLRGFWEVRSHHPDRESAIATIIQYRRKILSS